MSMSEQTQAGDVSRTQKLVQAICTELNNLDLQKQDNIPNQLQNILINALGVRSVSICPKYGKRCFPQLCMEDNCIYIYYFLGRDFSKEKNQEDTCLQLCIGAVLACCPAEFVDDCIGPDETFTSFSNHYPLHYNLATQLYDIINNNRRPQ